MRPTPAVLTPAPAAALLTQPVAAVERMRSYLSGMKPMSASEQLQLLRSAFPDATLADRVSACAPRS